MKRFYFNTHLKEAEKIIRKGVIKVNMMGYMDEGFTCIWLSSNPNWDIPPDAIFIDMRGFHSMDGEEIIPVRIEITVSDDFKDWTSYKKVANLSKRLIYTIEKYANADGIDPKNWYYSSENIPISQWVEIEYLENGKWTQFPPDNPSVRKPKGKG